MEIFTAVNPIIKAANLSKQISLKGNQLTILHEVSLEVNKSETVAIVGPSGAGKTTLLGLLAGLDTPTSGTVSLGGVDLSKLNEEERTQVRGINTSFIFQNFYLLENLTALENVMLPLEIHRRPQARLKALQILAEVGLTERVHHVPRQLSGGEQQRVAIARAFVTEPSVLFADEPTGNLDQATGDKIVDMLFAMNKDQATTLVIITHEASLAARCDRVIHLSNGGINS